MSQIFLKLTKSMPKIIEAIYKDGVFKSLEKVDLKDGERVRLEIKKDIHRLRGSIKPSSSRWSS